jgi:hypothetical protein
MHDLTDVASPGAICTNTGGEHELSTLEQETQISATIAIEATVPFRYRQRLACSDRGHELVGPALPGDDGALE